MVAEGEPGVPGAQGNDGIPGLNWKGEWNDITAYERNDVVFFNGSSYVAVADNTDDAPPSANWNMLAQQGSDTGVPGPVGITWRGTWSSATAYALRDGVTFDGTSYICTQAHTNHQPPNASYWDVLAAEGGTGGNSPLTLTNGDSVNLDGCQVVCSFGSGSCKRAKADALATATAIGLAAVGTNPPLSLMSVLVSGPVTATTAQWDAVTGQSGGLTAGAVYHLSNGTAGWLTTSVPSTEDHFVVRIGVALSSTTMLLQIQPPIQL
jgi:hypothetical protein